MLLIGTEDGTASVSNVEGLDFVKIRSTEELEDLIAHLKGGHYKSVSLDQGGGLWGICTKEVLGLDEIPINRKWGQADGRTWGVVVGQVKEHLSRIVSLAETHQINVVIIAHERNFKDEDTPSDIMLPPIGPDISPKVTNWLNGECDYICQTFVRKKVEMRSSKSVKGTKEIPVRTDETEYCLRIGQHDVYMTGFRMPVGVPIPADVIVNPNYEKVRSITQGRGKSV